MLKARDLYKEAATVYFRICGEVVLFIKKQNKIIPICEYYVLLLTNSLY